MRHSSGMRAAVVLSRYPAVVAILLAVAVVAAVIGLGLAAGRDRDRAGQSRAEGALGGVATSQGGVLIDRTPSAPGAAAPMSSDIAHGTGTDAAESADAPPVTAPTAVQLSLAALAPAQTAPGDTGALSGVPMTGSTNSPTGDRSVNTPPANTSTTPMSRPRRDGGTTSPVASRATSSTAGTTASATRTPPPATTSTTSPAPHRAAGTCATSQVWSNLDACGWPGPQTTGYPTGQVFSRTISGGLTIARNGTVVDGWKISGGIQVRATGVIIRNSWVTSSFGGTSGTGVINLNPGSSATIDHNLLDGQNATHACIWNEGAALTATHNECTATNDGIFSWATVEGQDGPGDHFTITDNWLHGFTTDAANGHVDGFQTEGAKHGLIRHNTIDVAQDQTSAVAIWNGRKDAADITVSDNLLAGGGFAVYAEDYSPSEASPAGGYSVTGIRFTDNVFSTIHFSCVGFWGVWYPRGAPTDGWHRSGNIVLETGQKIDAGNPVRGGQPCT